MSQLSLDQELLRVLRRAPDRDLGELGDAVGLPRTNFGRPLRSQLREPVERLLADGLIEEDNGRYRLTESGRQTLADRELGQPTSV
jgi:predicted transcriptional regulator